MFLIGSIITGSNKIEPESKGELESKKGELESKKIELEPSTNGESIREGSNEGEGDLKIVEEEKRKLDSNSVEPIKVRLFL